MTNKTKQAGFTVIEMLLIIVVLAALAVGGYWVWKHKADRKASNTSTVQKGNTKSSTQSQDTSATKDSNELNSDSKAVDNTDTNVGTNDAAQMGNQANSFY